MALKPFDPHSVSWPQDPHDQPGIRYEGFPRNVEYINNLKLDLELQPKKYEIAGTHGDSKILFTDVNILDSTGREPYRGDVFIEGRPVYYAFFLATVQGTPSFNH